MNYTWEEQAQPLATIVFLFFLANLRDELLLVLERPGPEGGEVVSDPLA